MFTFISSGWQIVYILYFLYYKSWMWKNPRVCSSMAKTYHFTCGCQQIGCAYLESCAEISDSAPSFSMKTYHNWLAMTARDAAARSSNTFAASICSISKYWVPSVCFALLSEQGHLFYCWVSIVGIGHFSRSWAFAFPHWPTISEV